MCCRVPPQVATNTNVLINLSLSGYLRVLGFRNQRAFIEYCIQTLPYGSYHIPDHPNNKIKPSNRTHVLQGKKSLPLLKDESMYHLFPHKEMADSKNKLNVWFKDVIQSAACYFPVAYSFLENNRAALLSLAPMYNDQASAVIMYYLALSGNSASYTNLIIACGAVLFPKAAKALSLVLKAVGAQTHLIGAMLCEAQTLTGRGVGDCDLLEEARYRCDPNKCKDKIFNVDPEALRPHVRAILRDELSGCDVEFPDIQTFWNTRWKWCVNGSHSAALGRKDPRFKVNVPAQQVHRRCVIEQLKDEPISDWDGNALFSGSLKLEHGKLRALFACDTLTYFCFEHLLRPVEKAWHGWRVILDPGHGGNINIVRRIRSLQESGVYNVMLDYEDFNSQHSISSQQVLFEELIDLVGYDRQLGQRLIDSFAQQDIYVGGKRIGRMHGTLCSGHRATTFVNSVLNAAYISFVMGGYESYKSMHVGDDVYIACPTATAAAELVTAVSGSGLRVNPTKQSVGVYVAEFLRMAVCPHYSVGYVARSISSAISGNWLTLHKQAPDEFLRTMVAHAWTIGNRAMYAPLGLILVHALCRITGLKRGKLSALVTGSTALASGPCRGCKDYYTSYDVVTSKPNLHSQEFYDVLDTLPQHASEAYLAHATTPLEVMALRATGISLEDALKEASYMKTLSSSDQVNDYKASVVLQAVPHRVRCCYTVDRFVHEHNSSCSDNAVGVLLRYPLIVQIRNYLTAPIIQALLEEIGAFDPNMSLDVLAWGYEPHSVIVDGYLPYNDVVSYSAGVSAELVRTHYNICM